MSVSSATAPEHALVWAEIPVTDLARAVSFYNTVFGYDLKIDESGPNPMAMIPTADGQGCAAHLYPGEPAGDGRGNTLHLVVPDTLEAARDRFRDAGGEIISDPITIPVGRFVYGRDPDGNSIGLFQYG